MLTFLGILAGACYSGAYLASRPLCFVLLAISTALVAYIRYQ